MTLEIPCAADCSRLRHFQTRHKVAAIPRGAGPQAYPVKDREFGYLPTPLLFGRKWNSIVPKKDCAYPLWCPPHRVVWWLIMYVQRTACSATYVTVPSAPYSGSFAISLNEPTFWNLPRRKYSSYSTIQDMLLVGGYFTF